jgi:hypothetical protein
MIGPGFWPGHYLFGGTMFKGISTQRDIVPGVIDNNVIELYTDGDCWYLAWHMHLLSGFDLAMVGRIDNWYHFGVLSPNGMFIDIYGPADLEEVVNKWDANVNVVTAQEFVDDCMDDFYASDDEEYAKITEEFARMLLESQCAIIAG